MDDSSLFANKSVKYQHFSWIHAVPLSYRTLNSDVFQFLTLQGWDFEKSKFLIKLSKKFDSTIFYFFFENMIIFVYICQIRALHINPPPPKKNRPSLMDMVNIAMEHTISVWLLSLHSAHFLFKKAQSKHWRFNRVSNF